MIPGLSKGRIDQARNHATETGKGHPILEKPIYRARIENAKVDHFLDYISRPGLLQDVAFKASAVFTHEESASSKTIASSMGWALKATQKRPHLEEKVKANLIEKFEAGERSGTKADPLSVLREMKLKRDGKGKLVFQPEEWKMEC